MEGRALCLTRDDDGSCIIRTTQPQSKGIQSMLGWRHAGCAGAQDVSGKGGFDQRVESAMQATVPSVVVQCATPARCSTDNTKVHQQELAMPTRSLAQCTRQPTWAIKQFIIQAGAPTPSSGRCSFGCFLARDTHTHTHTHNDTTFHTCHH